MSDVERAVVDGLVRDLVVPVLRAVADVCDGIGLVSAIGLVGHRSRRWLHLLDASRPVADWCRTQADAAERGGVTGFGVAPMRPPVWVFGTLLPCAQRVVETVEDVAHRVGVVSWSPSVVDRRCRELWLSVVADGLVSQHPVVRALRQDEVVVLWASGLPCFEAVEVLAACS